MDEPLKRGDQVMYVSFWGKNPAIVNKVYQNGYALIDDYLWDDFSAAIRWGKLVKVSKLYK